MDPAFVDSEDGNFSLQDSSPCIDAGNPNQYDSDGSIRDIGANPYNDQYCSESGDLNNDNSVNVLDVVELVDCILFNENCTICFDINQDNEYNVLDILDIVTMVYLIMNE